jgi:hypothetical protein
MGMKDFSQVEINLNEGLLTRRNGNKGLLTGGNVNEGLLTGGNKWE